MRRLSPEGVEPGVDPGPAEFEPRWNAISPLIHTLAALYLFDCPFPEGSAFRSSRCLADRSGPSGQAAAIV